MEADPLEGGVWFGDDFVEEGYDGAFDEDFDEDMED